MRSGNQREYGSHLVSVALWAVRCLFLSAILSTPYPNLLRRAISCMHGLSGGLHVHVYSLDILAREEVYKYSMVVKYRNENTHKKAHKNTTLKTHTKKHKTPR